MTLLIAGSKLSKATPGHFSMRRLPCRRFASSDRGRPPSNPDLESRYRSIRHGYGNRLHERRHVIGVDHVIIALPLQRAPPVETRHRGLAFVISPRLRVDPQLPAQRRKRRLRSLYYCSDGVRVVALLWTDPSHMAFFHSNERIAPSNPGIKQLGQLNGRMCWLWRSRQQLTSQN